MIRDNATPGCCVVCGKLNRMDLCRECRLQYRNPKTGELPFWLTFLRSDQKRRGRIDAENREIAYGLSTEVRATG